MKKNPLFFTLELDLVPHILGSPVAELVQDWDEGLCLFRKRIFHFRRDLRVYLQDARIFFITETVLPPAPFMYSSLPATW